MNHLNQPSIFPGVSTCCEFHGGHDGSVLFFQANGAFGPPFADVSMVHGMRLFLAPCSHILSETKVNRKDIDKNNKNNKGQAVNNKSTWSFNCINMSFKSKNAQLG